MDSGCKRPGTLGFPDIFWFRLLEGILADKGKGSEAEKEIHAAPEIMGRGLNCDAAGVGRKICNAQFAICNSPAPPAGVARFSHAAGRRVLWGEIAD